MGTNNIINSRLKNSFGENYHLVDSYLIGKRRWIIFSDGDGIFYKRRYSELTVKLDSKSIINKREYFVRKMKAVLKGWDFSSVLIYTGIDDTVIVRDEIGLNYYTKINNVLQNKIPSIKTLLNKTDHLISQFNKIHNNKYNYNVSNLNTLKFKSKIIVQCPRHGDYLVSITNHLRGDKCMKCFREDHPGDYKALSKVKEKSIYLYHLKVEDCNGIFYKVGISNNPKRRITEIKRKSKGLIFKVEILDLIEGSIEYIVNLEKEFHSIFKEWKIKYIPKGLNNNGKYECYKW